MDKQKLIDQISANGIQLTEEILVIIRECKSITLFNSAEELAEAAVGGKDNDSFDVKYDVPGKGEVHEAYVHRVKNGVSANYTEPYLRRRDPDTMAIADDKPTDKPRFQDKYGYPFETLKQETFKWLKEQDLAIFFYFAGFDDMGVGGVAIAPMNAGFFVYSLALLQRPISLENVPPYFKVESVIFVAPPFRHTHFDGKQVIVHNRAELHELYSYNLYPGPSAKKGIYGMLIEKGVRENWVTAHCSTVQVISPYDNSIVIMHEGASGGGKSEMLQHIIREPSGHILIGENTVNTDKRLIMIPVFCSFRPVTDDMALCHPSIQKGDGKLGVADAENGWFIRVDGVNAYGDDPYMEKMTVSPKQPIFFLNIDTIPNSTALIWDHIEDAPGKRCPNPRVIVPRSMVDGVMTTPVSVDVRSFGVRAPICTRENPSYGILGLFHLLPPALAWLWRLVSPRGQGNPSIVSKDPGIGSEGVGSYWPFAAGKKVRQANLLLDQIISTPNVCYTLTPNQHIGVWKVGFKPQLLMREYLTRRGSANLRPDQYQPARASLLGYELNYLSIEGSKIPRRLLKVYRQKEVGLDGYDAGYEILKDYFKKEVSKYLTPDLSPLGRQIIEMCLNDATVSDYAAVIPTDHNKK